MSVLIATRGLPGSGKSTLARRLEEESNGTVVRVNRDDLRYEAFGKYVGLSKQQERDITQMQQDRVRSALSAGKNVIVDDTGLNPFTLSSWRSVAEDYDGKVQFKVHDVPTPIDECVRRDAARMAKGERGVGEKVIRELATRYMKGKDELPRIPQYITAPIPVPPESSARPNAVIFDMDGTLCDVRSIRHHVRAGKKRNFHAFHMDSAYCPPNLAVLEMAQQCKEKGLAVVIVTAREERYRGLTERWLKTAGIEYDAIYTRPAYDQRRDYETKKEILGKLSKHFRVVHAVDDNPQVLELWKEEGIKTTIVPGFDDPITEDTSVLQIDSPFLGGRCLKCNKKMKKDGVLGPECEKAV